MPISIPKIITTVKYPHIFWMWLQLVKLTCFSSPFKPLFSIRLSFMIRELKKIMQLCIYTILLIKLSLYLDVSYDRAALFLLSILKRLAAGSHLVLLGELIRPGKKGWGIFERILRGGSGTYLVCQIHLGQLLHGCTLKLLDLGEG